MRDYPHDPDWTLERSARRRDPAKVERKFLGADLDDPAVVRTRLKTVVLAALTAAGIRWADDDGPEPVAEVVRSVARVGDRWTEAASEASNPLWLSPFVAWAGGPLVSRVRATVERGTEGDALTRAASLAILAAAAGDEDAAARADAYASALGAIDVTVRQVEIHDHLPTMLQAIAAGDAEGLTGATRARADHDLERARRARRDPWQLLDVLGAATLAVGARRGLDVEPVEPYIPLLFVEGL